MQCKSVLFDRSSKANNIFIIIFSIIFKCDGAYFHLWTFSLTVTSSAVEAEFNDCKHRLLKNISRPMCVNKFVTLHLKSFPGRTKLAIAE